MTIGSSDVCTPQDEERSPRPDQPEGEEPGRRSRRGRWPAVLVVAGLALSLLLGTQVLGRGPQASPASTPRTAQPVTEYPSTERGAPVSLGGTDLTGQELEIGALRGAPVVLNIWGSWCGPCRTEAPVLKAVSAAYAGRGVQFVGINVKDNRAAAAAFERRFGITYPSLDDESGRASLSLSQYLPASVVPATLVLDREGRVSARVLGAVEESTLRALLDSVIAEP